MADSPPDSERIKTTVDELERFVQWIVAVLAGPGWTKKLLLLDALLFATLNPISFTWLYQLFAGASPLPRYYILSFWALVTAVFLVAVVTAWRARPKPRPHLDLAGRSAIKGLLPYGPEDAGLFVHLQREQELKECVRALLDPGFRLGLLCGDSGTGKTSFLRAALLPVLREQGHCCLDVKCTDSDPADSISQAVAETFAADDGVRATDSLPSRLEALARLDSAHSLVIVLDQFEQFFVNHKRRADRESFLEWLADLHRRTAVAPIKIVLCVRSDFVDRLIEIQRRLGYSLGPHQSFRLEGLTARQAAKVFQVLGEQEGITCDRAFVERMTAEQLASADDGLISPVDIQIVSWMIAGSSATADRAFNERSFQQMGGVEGLLEAFLARALDSRENPSRRDAAIKVLLALTDLDGNARAGALSVGELKEKLRGQIAADAVEEAVAWLGRGDVRLISPVARRDGSGKATEAYELAHERLIAPLRRVSGRQLTEVDNVRRLLDRRLNEWLGNDRASRYLLTWREVVQVRNVQALLSWGPQRAAMESLIAASRTRVRRLRLLALFPVFAAIAFFIVSGSPWGRLQWVRLDLHDYAGRAADQRTLAKVATAYFADGDFSRGHEVLSQVRDPSALISSAQESASFRDAGRATALLEALLRSTDRVASHDQHYVLESIVGSGSELRDSARVLPLLERVQARCARLQNEERDRMLFHVANAYLELRSFAGAQRLLEILLRDTRQLPGSFSLSPADNLGEIAESVAKLPDPRWVEAQLESVLRISQSLDPYDSERVDLSVATAAMVLPAQNRFPFVRHALARLRAEEDFRVVDLAGARSLAKAASQTLSVRDMLGFVAALPHGPNHEEFVAEVLTSLVPPQESEAAGLAAAESLVEVMVGIAATFSDPLKKQRILSKVSTELARLADSGPKASLAEILRNAEPLFLEGVPSRVALAKAWNAMGEFSRAETLLTGVIAGTEFLGPSYPLVSVPAIEAAAALQPPARADSVLNYAARRTDLADPSDRAMIFIELARANIRLKRYDNAASNLERSMRIVGSEPSSSDYSVYMTVAEVASSLDPPRARDVLERMLRDTTGTPIDNRRFLLQSVAQATTGITSNEDALELLEQVLQMGEGVSDFDKLQVFRDVARAAGHIDSTAAATSILLKVLSRGETISERHFVLAAVAEATEHVSDYAGARKVLESVMRSAASLSGYNRWYALNPVIAIAASHADWRLAHDAALRNGSDDDRAFALASILVTYNGRERGSHGAEQQPNGSEAETAVRP